MPCYHPLNAFQSQSRKLNGTLHISFQWFNGCVSVKLPCGQCVGCRLDRSRQWAVRCVHEAQLYSRSCYITLTYSPEHLPPGGSLRYKDFQDFMKRYRFAYSGIDQVDDARPIRFYMAGEYGEDFGRPHYHALIFNHDFDDRVFFKKTRAGARIYRSKKLEALWPFGYSSVGDVDFKSAAYVARYIMKKVNGDRKDQHYESIDPETGEIFWRVPEFNKMSLKPGIGARWLDKFASDVFPRDYVIINGRRLKTPRYYDNRYEASGFDGAYDIAMQVKPARAAAALLSVDDNTTERLLVKEQVTLAKLSLLKRPLS